MDLVLTDIPDDILVEILCWCWTCGPKRTNKNFQNCMTSIRVINSFIV